MRAASCYKPKERNPNKPDGEDAHFIIPWLQTICVADGVGGYAKHGIDSGEYSRGILSNIIMAFVDSPLSCDSPPIDFPYLSRILNKGYSNTCVPGASTLCLVTLSGHDLLCLNVGDSGFRVIREGKTVYSSSPQVTGFNHPYQLGIYSDNLWLASKIRVRVEIGDVVVVATDGLFDNVFLEDLEKLVNYGKRNNDTPDNLAKTITEYAHIKSLDTYYRSPFTVEAEKVGKKSMGGKKDDITVVVAYIE
ncbi:hypothetical protein Leryth_024742 [Lithospermum erythrorhizon]|nr:hypothetical protein Leryth_024742 [Lithospermum erythrorhizon]